MLKHNHIFQSENGVEGCPACDSIDPYHHTEHHYISAVFQTFGYRPITRGD